MIDMENVVSKLDELRQLADTEIHPIVSPDNWDVYSKLCDLIDLAKADILDMLKEQEARELTMDEWREWKNNPKRNPICELWEHDTSPMWVLNPDTIHEPALLMGKLKLFTGKPTFEQCKAVKWDAVV